MEVTWRIYYTDGSTFDNSEGAPSDAPPLGVGIIVATDASVGRIIMHRWDWYFHRDGVWWGADIFGLLDNLMQYAPEITAVCQGRTALNPEWNALLERASSDPDFPPKSATRPGERP